jgi:hypothetical protein
MLILNMFKTVSRSNRALRFPLAAVWLYQGFWCKLLGRSPRHRRIVASVPGAAGLLPAIGAAECALAAWILSGRLPRGAAIAQTALLAGMNAGGLLWAEHEISDPAGMILQNAAFLSLAWVVAKEPAAEEKNRHG